MPIMLGWWPTKWLSTAELAEVDGIELSVTGELIQGRHYSNYRCSRPGRWGKCVDWSRTAADARSPEAPDAQLGIAALSETDTLTWPPATDNVGVTHYEIRIDGQLITLVDSTTEQYT